MKAIVQTNDRGQITIPKKFRELVEGLDVLEISYKDGIFILEPLHTRDEFIEELEKRSEEAKNEPGYSIEEVDEMMKKHYSNRK